MRQDPCSEKDSSKEWDDVVAMVRDRDRDAFQRIYTAHAAGAYSLARMTPAPPERAEEALQEAMMRIWRYQGKVKPQGPLRNWIYKIVSRECVRIYHERSRKSLDATEAGSLYQGSGSSERSSESLPEEEVERQEWIRRLQGLLRSMAPEERRLLALHFGAEMSHGEIGRLLEMPRRTVGYRIRTTVTALRSRLGLKGVAGTVALSAGVLGQSILQCHVPPPGVVERMGEVSLGAAQAIVPATAAGISKAGLMFVMVAALSTAAGIGWWVWNPESQKPGGVVEPGNPVGSAGVGEAQEQAPTFSRTYVFDTGLPEGLKCIGGVQWVPGKSRLPGALEVTDSDRDVLVLLPDVIPPVPLKIEIEGHASSGKNFRSNQCELLALPIQSVAGDGISPSCNSWAEDMTLTGRKFLSTAVWDGRFALNRVNGNVFKLREYRQDRPAGKILLLLKNVKIYSIRIVALQPDERQIAAADIVRVKDPSDPQYPGMVLNESKLSMEDFQPVP